MGIGRQGWGMVITMAVIVRLERVTGIEQREGSELRQSLLKIYKY